MAAVNDYRPFGLVLSSVEGSPMDGGGGDPYGFTGEWWEDDAGLLFLRARYYDPATGRFVSQDPWRGEVRQPRTRNRFAYVLNNPANGTDPSGLQCSVNVETGEMECFGDVTGMGQTDTIRTFVPYIPPDCRFSQWGCSTGGGGILEDVLSVLSRGRVPPALISYSAGAILEFADSGTWGFLSTTFPDWYADDDPYFVLGRYGGRAVSDVVGAVEMGLGAFCGKKAILAAVTPGGQPIAVISAGASVFLIGHGGTVLVMNRMRPLPQVYFAETRGESDSSKGSSGAGYSEVNVHRSDGSRITDIDSIESIGGETWLIEEKSAVWAIDPKAWAQNQIVEKGARYSSFAYFESKIQNWCRFALSNYELAMLRQWKSANSSV